jgi:protoporphyrinogen oxidase
VRTAVIGGGIAGLVAAYDLSAAGAAVTVFERAPQLGGQAASFEVAPGEAIERYYHFICKGDSGYQQMLAELGIAHRLRWRTTSMGLYYRGELHSLGDPLSLLAFPHLGVRDKARFAWTTAAAKLRPARHWLDLENVPAIEWLARTYGPRASALLFEPLVRSKFQDHADSLSAAWMWARIKRLGDSRTLLMKERIGYLEGGSQAYVDALESAARDRHVEMKVSTAVERVVVDGGRARGLVVEGDLVPFDAVLSTVPIPHTRQLFADLDDAYFRNLRSLEYLGVVVMVLRVSHRYSPHYWTNVNDDRLPVSGVIEATNLNPLPTLGGDAMLYIPQYLSFDDPRASIPDADLFDRYCEALAVMNPAFDRSWVRRYWVHRERYTQPLCDTGFAARMPTIRTSVPNLFVTDSYQLNPHDRAISFSTDLGREAARLILENL